MRIASLALAVLLSAGPAAAAPLADCPPDVCVPKRTAGSLAALFGAGTPPFFGRLGLEAELTHRALYVAGRGALGLGPSRTSELTVGGQGEVEAGIPLLGGAGFGRQRLSSSRTPGLDDSTLRTPRHRAVGLVGGVRTFHGAPVGLRVNGDAHLAALATVGLGAWTRGLYQWVSFGRRSSRPVSTRAQVDVSAVYRLHPSGPLVGGEPAWGAIGRLDVPLKRPGALNLRLEGGTVPLFGPWAQAQLRVGGPR